MFLTPIATADKIKYNHTDENSLHKPETVNK